jgi:hypothetical protein
MRLNGFDVTYEDTRWVGRRPLPHDSRCEEVSAVTLKGFLCGIDAAPSDAELLTLLEMSGVSVGVGR